MTRLSFAVLLLGAVFVLLVVAAQSANILFALSASSRSHKNIMDPIMIGLLRKGHNVTVLSQFTAAENPPGVTTVLLKDSRTSILRAAEKYNFFTMADMSPIRLFLQINGILLQTAADTFSDPTFIDFVKSRHRFDLVAIDGIANEYLLALAYHYGAPAILVSSNHIFPETSWNLNIPEPPSVHPILYFQFPVPMSFKHRFFNSIFLCLNLWNRRFWYHPSLQEIVDLHFPGAPSLLEMEKNVSFVFSNTFPSLTGPKPSMPYLMEVGGIHCRPPKKLDADVEKMISDSGENGFIVFSLGSLTKGTLIPEEFRQKLLKIFASLKQTILWKFEGNMSDVPENVKLINWLPQQDLLGHPKCKLFITHGGLLSIEEAVYHAVPILIIPLAIDQHGNAFKSLQQGYAEVIYWNEFSVEEAVSKIKNLTNNNEFKKNVQKQSELFRDRPVDLIDTSVYWMEYVIRTGGAHHLKSSAGQLSFVQYFLLDVIAVIVLALAILLTVLMIAICGICRFLKNRYVSRPTVKKQKAKTKFHKKEN